MVYLGTPSSSSPSSSCLGPVNGGSVSNKNSNGSPALAPPPPLAAGACSSSSSCSAAAVELPSSRSPSHKDDQDSAGGSDEEREGRIRVGKDYQINPTAYIEIEDRKMDQCPERALLVWSPAPQISANKLDEYIQVAKEKFGYNAEQALGMLFWHKHDLDRALQDLANFTPFPDEWSVEDKVLFEQAFQFHGKSFHRIRQMLPDKTIAQLVKYYYSWKKTRTRTSLMDRQARKLQVNRETASTPGVDDPVPESDNDEDKESQQKPKCFNCGILCHVTHPTPKGQMCGTCHQYYTRTGKVRPTTGPIRKDGTKSKHSLFKNSNKPPKGMYVNHDDLVALATGPHPQGEALLKSMDREIVSYKRNVQNNKQNLSDLQSRSRGFDVAPYRIPSKSKASGDDAASSAETASTNTTNDAPTSPSNTINAKWTNDELNLGVQGIRTLGKNFKVIAEIIGTKTESHVRSFFVNYRRRYNLDAALKEYEAVNGPSPADEDDNNSNNSNGSKSGGDRDPKDGASETKTNGSVANSATTVTPAATPTTTSN